MGATVEVAGYWLPSEFFDDSVMDKNNVDPDLCFPTEFPYDHDNLSGERLKEKGRVMSTSPQSTLAHMWSAGGSSPKGVTSPPSPGEDATGDLIYRAAGRVAKLNLNDVVTPRHAKSSSGPNLYPSVHRNVHLEEQMANQQQKQGSGTWHGGPQQWPVQRRVGMPGPRAVSVGGSGYSAVVKRECAGTGVFLPRRFYGDYTHNDCNNTAYSPGYIPQRNGFAPFQPLQFNPGFVPEYEYDLLMARRNALLLQNRRSLLLQGSARVGRRVCLPPEWSY